MTVTHRAHLAPLTLVTCWSSGFIGATLAAGSGAEAEATLFWRFLLTAGLLVLVLGCLRRRPRPGQAVRDGVIGVLSQGVYLYGVFRGATYGVSPGAGALIASLQPLVVAALFTLLGRRPRAAQLGGMVLSLTGVLLVASTDLGGSPAGMAWVAVGVLGLAVGTMLSERWSTDADADLLSTLACQAVAATLFFGLLGTGGTLAPGAWPAFGKALALLVLVAFLAGYGSYLVVVRTSGSLTASTWLCLTPGVAALWAWAAFGDAIGPLAAAGLATSFLGVLVATRGGGPRRPAASPEGRGVPAPQAR